MAKALKHTLPVLAFLIIVYHMVQTVRPVWTSPWYHNNIHLGLALVLIFLVALQQKPRQWPVLLPLIVLSIAVTAYMGINYEDLQVRISFPTNWDLVIGGVVILIVFEACRRAIGWSLIIAALLFIGYALIGSYLPRPFYTPYLSPFDVIHNLTTSLEGVYGMLLSISAYFIFLFVVMGGIMQVTAAPRFFNAVGNMAGRALKGGPGIAAVVSSALLGTTLGSSSANVAITGAFTIPLMKKVGYAPHEAAAIEATTSTGGQIMPPVMGAAAFVMANYTGVAYAVIILIAAVPALLYFLSAGLYVQLTALKRGIKPEETMDREIGGRELLLSAPAFLAPLAVIVFLFMKGFSPPYVAVWAVVTVIVFGFLLPGKRLSLREWGGAFYQGAHLGARIAVTIATTGMVVEMLIVTGLGIKFPAIVEAWSQGSLAIALILVMASSIILGMGIPTTPAYIIVALVGAPVLVRLGIPLLPAHLFVFYFAVMSMVTPPIAPSAILASRMAGASYMRTAVESAKVAVAGFLVPFMFVMSPVFILRPEGEIPWIITSVIGGLLMILSTQVGFVNYFFTDLRRVERALFLVCAVLLFVYIVVLHSYVVFLAAMAIFAVLTFNQWRQWRSAKAVTVGAV